jgi:hypothetical protein
MDCLTAAGLADVEERTPTFWRGYNSSPFFMVSIERLAGPTAARELARDADLVWAEPAGSYIIVGPSVEISDEGLVAAVASCVRKL